MMGLGEAIRSALGGKMKDGGTGGGASPVMHRDQGGGLGNAIRNFGTKMQQKDAATGMPQQGPTPMGQTIPQPQQPQREENPLRKVAMKQKLAQALAFLAEANGVGGNSPAAMAAQRLGAQMQELKDMGYREDMIGALRGMGNPLPGGEFLEEGQLQGLILANARHAGKMSRAGAIRSAGGGRRGGRRSAAGGSSKPDPKLTAFQRDVADIIKNTGMSYEDAVHLRRGGKRSSGGNTPEAAPAAATPSLPEGFTILGSG